MTRLFRREWKPSSASGWTMFVFGLLALGLGLRARNGASLARAIVGNAEHAEKLLVRRSPRRRERLRLWLRLEPSRLRNQVIQAKSRACKVALRQILSWTSSHGSRRSLRSDAIRPRRGSPPNKNTMSHLRVTIPSPALGASLAPIQKPYASRQRDLRFETCVCLAGIGT